MHENVQLSNFASDRSFQFSLYWRFSVILTVWRNGEKMLATVYVPVLWYDSANRYGESRAPARDHSSPFSATDWHDVKK